MKRFLDAWKSLLTPVQAQIISETIQQNSIAETYSSKEEFANALYNLKEALATKIGKPLLSKVSQSYGDLISSEVFNHHLNGINKDLFALYTEIDNEYRILSSHANYLNQNIISSLSSQIENLETQLTTYELLSGGYSGFSVVQYNDFKDSGERRLRDTNDTDSLFSDRKTQSYVPQTNDCKVLPGVGKLVLPEDPSESYSAKVLDIKINENFSTMGNTADNKLGGPSILLQGKSWLYDIVYYFKPNTNVYLGIDIVLAGVPKINYLTLSPIPGETSIIVDSLYAGDPSGNLTPISVAETDLIGEPLSQISTFTFDDTFASKIVVVLRQPSYKIDGKDFSNKNSYNNGVFGANKVIGNNQNISQEGLVNKQTGYSKPGKTGNASFKLAYCPTEYINIIGADQKEEESPLYNPEEPPLYSPNVILPEVESGVVDVFIYPFGISYIDCGLKSFLDYGIFVSLPITVPYLNRIALDTSYDLPSLKSTVLGPGGGIEFYIFKKDFNEKGENIENHYFSIHPYRESTIERERIYPLSNGMAKLTLPALTMINGETTLQENITVYRNGIALAESEWTAVEVGTIGKETWVYIPGAQYVDTLSQLNDIYTVSYTPAFYYPKELDEGGNYLYDSTGDLVTYTIDYNKYLWYNQDGTINHEPIRINENAVSSEVQLIIFLRQLTTNTLVTPIVHNYKLLMSSLTNV